MTPEERFTRIENALQVLTENQGRHDSAIRDLITVGRTSIDSIVRLSDVVTVMSEAQKHTDEKLNALIDTVREHEGKIDALIDTVREHRARWTH